MCWPYFFSISSYLNLTLLPEECLFSLRRNAFEKELFFFFKDEIISENSTAPILLLIVLISFIHFFFGHHCGKFVRIKNEIISTNCKRKNDSYEFV